MNSIAIAAWCAALFLTTVLFSHTVALRLLLLLAGCALIATALARKRWSGANADTTFLPPLALPFALWAAWAALSITWSLDPELSGKEFRNEIVYAFLALWLCYVGAQARNAARIFLPVIALGAAAACAVSISYFWFGPPANARWLHGGPGTHSSALLTLFPCTFMFAWVAARKHWSPIAVAAASALIVLYCISAYATLNRKVWIGFAAQLVVIGAMLLARPGRVAIPSRRAWVIAGLAATLVFASVAAMLAKVQVERAPLGGIALTEDPRFALWPIIVERIEGRPFTGTGFGRGIERRELRNDPGISLVWHSHNLLLDAALQVGLTGLALLALLLGWTLRLGWQRARTTDEVASACGIALLAVVVGMLVRNMTDVLWVRQAALLYWGTAGFLLGYGTSVGRTNSCR